MKKLNLNGKLNLKKETITKLNESEAKVIMGGWTAATCNVGTYTTCPKTIDCPTTGRNC